MYNNTPPNSIVRAIQNELKSVLRSRENNHHHRTPNTQGSSSSSFMRTSPSIPPPPPPSSAVPLVSPLVLSSAENNQHQQRQRSFSTTSSNFTNQHHFQNNTQQQQQQQQQQPNANDDTNTTTTTTVSSSSSPANSVSTTTISLANFFAGTAANNEAAAAAVVHYAYQHHNPNPEFHRAVVSEQEIELYAISYPRLHAWQIYNVCCEFDDEDERIARLDRLDSWGSVLGPLVQASQVFRESRNSAASAASASAARASNNVTPAETAATTNSLQQNNASSPSTTITNNNTIMRRGSSSSSSAFVSTSFSPTTEEITQSNHQLQHATNNVDVSPQRRADNSNLYGNPSSFSSSYALVIQELQAKLAEGTFRNNNNLNAVTSAGTVISSSTAIPSQQTMNAPPSSEQQNHHHVDPSTNETSSSTSYTPFEQVVQEYSRQYPRLPRSVIQRVLTEIPTDTGRRSSLNSLTNWLTIMNTTSMIHSHRQTLLPVSASNENRTNNNNVTTTAPSTNTVNNTPTTTTTTTTTAVPPTWFQNTRNLRRAPTHLSMLRELTETAPRFRWDTQFQQHFPEIDPALVRRNERLNRRREDCLRFRDMYPNVPVHDLERIVREEVSDEVRVRRLTKLVNDIELSQMLKDREEALERQQKMAVDASKKNCCEPDQCVVCNELKRLEKVLMMTNNNNNNTSTSTSSPKKNGNDDHDVIVSDDVVLLCELHQRQLLFAQQRGVGGGGGAASTAEGGGENTTNPSNNNESSDSNECYVCMSAPRTFVIYPCGHKCFCSICAVHVKIESCPICRKAIKDIFRVFD